MESVIIHTSMKKAIIFLLFTLYSLASAPYARAQQFIYVTVTPTIATESALLATESASLASPSANEHQMLQQIKKEDITNPEEEEAKREFFVLFAKRQISEPTWSNIMAFAVQYAVRTGVPANTVMLILLLPFLASIVAFFRHIIGLPSLGLIVPIALSITLLSTGLTAGFILLATILFASTVARITLKRLRIMQLPKIALSVWVVALFVFLALTASASIGILAVKNLSIFPVLLLILLSERIVELQLERNPGETLLITAVTLALGVLGYVLLSSPFLRQMVLLYPESILLVIPIDIAIGRYFGLRLSEYIRFSSILNHGSK